MSIKPIFAWYDMWIGAFWDAAKRRLYIFPVPMLGVVIQFTRPLAPGQRVRLTEVTANRPLAVYSADPSLAPHRVQNEGGGS